MPPGGAANPVGKKKKSKGKNKKKNPGQQQQPQQPQQQQQQQTQNNAQGSSENRSRSSSDAGGANPEPASPAPIAPAAPVAQAPAPAEAPKSSNQLLHNLALEANENAWKYSNWAEIKDAEKLYYDHITKNKSPAPSQPKPSSPKDDSDDIDFFASDEDELPKAKPQLMRVQPRGPPPSILAKQKNQSASLKKKGKADKTPSTSSEGPISSDGFKSNLAAEIAKARQHIKNSLECVDGIAAMASGTELINKLNTLEVENKNLRKVTDDLRGLVSSLEQRIASLEVKTGSVASAKAKASKADDDDDDIDLFGSSDEDEDADKVRVREERLKAYAEKKSKKPALIAKTSVLLDVKPWDDETDMDTMLKSVKSIQKEGLVWGASKLVPVGYGIKKLQVMCVVEDEKVSIDELCEQIQEFEDFVQSVDIAAMSKI